MYGNDIRFQGRKVLRFDELKIEKLNSLMWQPPKIIKLFFAMRIHGNDFKNMNYH